MKRLISMLFILLMLSACVEGKTAQQIPESEPAPTTVVTCTSEKPLETVTASCELDWCRMSMEIPEGWDFNIRGLGIYTEKIHVQPEDTVTIRFWPVEDTDAVFELTYYKNGLFLCGTGASFYDFELTEELYGTVREESYSDGSLSQLYFFSGQPGDYAMNTNLSPEAADRWKAQAMEILSTAKLGEGIMHEAEAIEAAMEHCTVEYDTVHGRFDSREGCWQIHFSMENTAGGDQTVTVSPDGTVISGEWGE